MYRFILMIVAVCFLFPCFANAADAKDSGNCSVCTVQNCDSGCCSFLPRKILRPLKCRCYKSESKIVVHEKTVLRSKRPCKRLLLRDRVYKPLKSIRERIQARRSCLKGYCK